MIKPSWVSADDVGKRGASSSCSSCNKRSWSCRVLPQSHYTPYTVSKMVACKYSSLSVLLTATGKDSHSHRTDVCDIAPTIPYWSCRLVWNLANEHQLVNVVINIFCYCFQMKDKRTQRSNINVMSLLKNNHQQCSTFRKKSWGQLAPKFSFFVARTSILVAKNYITGFSFVITDYR